MKITTFSPQIFTNDEEPLIKLFEELGFEKYHDKKDIGMMNAEAIVMKDAGGFTIDISKSDIELPQDMVGIRINVDDFDEAYRILLKHGFKNVYGKKTADTESSKSAVLVRTNGVGINLVEHIKNHD